MHPVLINTYSFQLAQLNIHRYNARLASMVTASRAALAKGSAGVRDIKCSRHRLCLEGSIHFASDVSGVS